MWPHGIDEDIAIFRLDDHVLIWKALQSMNDLDAWSSSHLDAQSDDSEDDGLEMELELAKKISLGELQRAFLGHFTTENDISGKRMLAVTRSVRETRFLLHARDTTLFYGLDWGLPLEHPSVREVWGQHDRITAPHDGNQESSWDNAIRYALAVVMGCRGMRINRRSPNIMVKTALEVLFRSTGQMPSLQAI